MTGNKIVMVLIKSTDNNKNKIPINKVSSTMIAKILSIVFIKLPTSTTIFLTISVVPMFMKNE